MIRSPRRVVSALVNRWQEVVCGNCGKRNLDVDVISLQIRFKCSERSCKTINVVPISIAIEAPVSAPTVEVS